MSIRTIGVVGAGAMGSGIAHVAATAGYDVILRDIDISFVDRAVSNMQKVMTRAVEKGRLTEEALDATLARIKKTTVLEDMADADFVIEVVLEKMDLKKEVFQILDKVCRPDVILATNTSSMSITEIAATTSRPDKVCGVHFFNPAQVMKLVEIIRGIKTSDATISVATDLARAFGKTTVEVKKDSPGFLVNRLMIPMTIEAARLLQEGVASVEDIDTAIKLGLNHPMGPFELMDFTGIDIQYSIMEYFAEEFHDGQYGAPQVIKQMIRSGKIGRKSGEGFYKY